MHTDKDQSQFNGGVFLLLLLPYFLLNFFVDKMPTLVMVAALLITTSCMILHFYRNRHALLEGILASILLLALLSACAFIPVIGWIIDAIVVLYALSSVFAALKALVPLAFKAALMWVVFFVTLLPEIHHPIFSPLAYVVFCYFVTSALSKKADPYGALILLMASMPLLMVVIASLGRMFQSSVGTGSTRVGQNISGYTRQGVNVDGYTRMITKDVTTVTTSTNLNSVLTNTSVTHSVNKNDA